MIYLITTHIIKEYILECSFKNYLFYITSRFKMRCTLSEPNDVVFLRLGFVQK
ncbi:MAG: hypothetical protein BAJALOKI1v1_1690001 [Promethearchaeota archaeon]|nr:MAG: hypothetical protein BAJALOKI1v1_1690001 [Candidatus Lokiarchaeota archaeon]